MIGIGLVLTRAGGWPRMLLLGACTAIVSGLLLVVVAILRLPARPAEPLFALVGEPGLRVGTAFGALMLAVPAVLLLYQAVRLGTAARERRLASLRLGGATPGDVRALGLIEVAVPAFGGSVAGIGVYVALRVVLGTGAIRLVPTTVGPAWWQVPLVIVAVTGLGVVVGLLASRRVVVTPLGVTRRQAPPPPGPWGLLFLVAAGVLGASAFGLSRSAGTMALLVAIAVAVLGIMSLAPWVAHRAARLVLGSTASPALTLAAARVVAEPHAVGRAAAAVGGIALVAGGAGVMVDDALRVSGNDPFFLVSYGLVAMVLLVALLMVVGSLAVHSVESLLDRKRSIAALAALGTSTEEMERAQFAEIAIAALPMATAGVLLGSLAMGGLRLWTDLSSSLSIVIQTSALVAGTLFLVWVAAELAVRATRPWVRRAAAVDNLRTT